MKGHVHAICKTKQRNYDKGPNPKLQDIAFVQTENNEPRLSGCTYILSPKLLNLFTVNLMLWVFKRCVEI